MITLIIIPTQEEQAKIALGNDPDVSNIFTREFTSEKERDSYLDGFNSLSDLVEYDIIRQTTTSVTIEIEGETSKHHFDSKAEKEAYLEGLKDADGWQDPMTIAEDEELFAKLKGLLEANTPKP